MTCPFLVVVWISARADVAQFSCWICPGNVTARRRQPTGRPCRAGLGSKESSAAGTAAPHRASKQSPWRSRLDAAPRLCLKMRNCYFHSENDCQLVGLGPPHFRPQPKRWRNRRVALFPCRYRRSISCSCHYMYTSKDMCERKKCSAWTSQNVNLKICYRLELETILPRGSSRHFQGLPKDTHPEQLAVLALKSLGDLCLVAQVILITP